MAVFTGIAFPFSKDGSSFPAAATDDDLIQQSLIQLVLTAKGSRIMRPSYGSNAISYVFNNNTEMMAQLLDLDIRGSIAAFEPRVLVQNTEFTIDDATINITINYIVILTRTTGSLTIPLPTK